MQWLVFLFAKIVCAEKNNFKDGYKAESHTQSHEAAHIGNVVNIAGLNITNIFHYKRFLKVLVVISFSNTNVVECIKYSVDLNIKLSRLYIGLTCMYAFIIIRFSLP